MSDFLTKNGFEISNQFNQDRMDYSKIRDFRTRKSLSRSIIRHDLRLVKESDVLVVLPTPSFGAAMEMFFAKELGKETILFSEKPIPSPWPVNFADFITRDRKSLLATLNRIRNKK
ncbi:MAG: hypothetical protein KGI25_03460 [Thaumarchaeota archaeon]|nr:hypothetical protein [Nitrososphaerota archaeon]